MYQDLSLTPITSQASDSELYQTNIILNTKLEVNEIKNTTKSVRENQGNTLEMSDDSGDDIEKKGLTQVMSQITYVKQPEILSSPVQHSLRIGKKPSVE